MQFLARNCSLERASIIAIFSSDLADSALVNFKQFHARLLSRRPFLLSHSICIIYICKKKGEGCTL